MVINPQPREERLRIEGKEFDEWAQYLSEDALAQTSLFSLAQPDPLGSSYTLDGCANQSAPEGSRKRY